MDNLKLIGGFDLAKSVQVEKQELKGITLWVPENVKNLYDHLQAQSNRTYCKHLKDLLIQDIEATSEKKPA